LKGKNADLEEKAPDPNPWTRRWNGRIQEQGVGRNELGNNRI